MRIACPGLFDGVPNGIYEANGGANNEANSEANGGANSGANSEVSIRDCLEAYAMEHGVSLRENWTESVQVLKDNKLVRVDTVLTGDSEIIVIHRILGG